MHVMTLDRQINNTNVGQLIIRLLVCINYSCEHSSWPDECKRLTTNYTLTQICLWLCFQLTPGYQVPGVGGSGWFQWTGLYLQILHLVFKGLKTRLHLKIKYKSLEPLVWLPSVEYKGTECMFVVLPPTSVTPSPRLNLSQANSANLN